MYIELDSISNMGGNKFWGLRLFDTKGGKRIGTYNLRLVDMKELGVVQRQSETSKLKKWLNSEVGLNWLKPRLEKATYSSLGYFLPTNI